MQGRPLLLRPRETALRRRQLRRRKLHRGRRDHARDRALRRSAITLVLTLLFVFPLFALTFDAGVWFFDQRVAQDQAEAAALAAAQHLPDSDTTAAAAPADASLAENGTHSGARSCLQFEDRNGDGAYETVRVCVTRDFAGVFSSLSGLSFVTISAASSRQAERSRCASGCTRRPKPSSARASRSAKRRAGPSRPACACVVSRKSPRRVSTSTRRWTCRPGEGALRAARRPPGEARGHTWQRSMPAFPVRPEDARRPWERRQERGKAGGEPRRTVWFSKDGRSVAAQTAKRWITNVDLTPNATFSRRLHHHRITGHAQS